MWTISGETACSISFRSEKQLGIPKRWAICLAISGSQSQTETTSQYGIGWIAGGGWSATLPQPTSATLRVREVDGWVLMDQRLCQLSGWVTQIDQHVAAVGLRRSVLTCV